MFTFAVLCVAIGVSVRAWTRMTAIETDLAARVAVLEAWRQSVVRPVTPPADAPQTSAAPPTRETTAGTRAVAPPPILQLPPIQPEPAARPASPAASARTIVPMPVPMPSPVPSPMGAQTASGTALEMLIGGRWLLYAGIVVVIVGIALLEKLAIDNHWLSETARVLQGTGAGFALLGAGLYCTRRGLSVYGQLVCGAGIAALYLSTYAAFNFYGLIGISTAIALMSLVTVLAASIATHLSSEGISLVAICGGFATPFLLDFLGTNPTGLFTYNAVLIAGAVLLSRRHDWLSLNLASYVLTVLSAWSWLFQHYTSSQYLLTEFFFTLFCAMFLLILRHTSTSTHRDAPLARGLLWTAPALYYVASLGILMPHDPAILVFLVLAGAVGIGVSLRSGSAVRLGAAATVMLPLMIWTGDYGRQTSLLSGLGTWTVLWVMYVAGLIHGDVGRDKTFGHASMALLHLGGLLPFGGAYVLLDGGWPEYQGPLAAALAVLYVGLGVWSARRNREAGLHFVALAATFLTMAIALVLDGAWRTNALAVEGTTLTFLGLREQRDWLRAGGLVVFGYAALHLLWLQFGVRPSADERLLLNARALSGLAIVALTYLQSALHHRLADPRERPIAIAIGIVLAHVLTLSVLTSEIHARWFIKTWLSPTPGQAFPRQMLWSITWATYAVGLILVGFRKAYFPLRYLGLAVFTLTVVKVGTVDLALLDRSARVASTLGLGVALLAASYLYNRLNAGTSERHLDHQG